MDYQGVVDFHVGMVSVFLGMPEYLAKRFLRVSGDHDELFWFHVVKIEYIQIGLTDRFIPGLTIRPTKHHVPATHVDQPTGNLSLPH